MLKWIKRWLGWEEDFDYFNPDEFRPPVRPTSATARILANTQSNPQPAVKRTVQKKRAAPPPSKRPAALDVDPEPEHPQFDPYNTGKFDRSASWERISKSQR